MDTELLYNLINLIILPFWLMMIVTPRWDFAQKTMRAFWPVSIVPLIYAGLIVYMGTNMQGVELDFTLSGIAGMIGTNEGALIIWAHVLALDLFAGRWIYLDSQERIIPAWLVSIFIFATLMAGPAGLLMYFLARSYYKTEGAG